MPGASDGTITRSLTGKTLAPWASGATSNSISPKVSARTFPAAWITHRSRIARERVAVRILSFGFLGRFSYSLGPPPQAIGTWGGPPKCLGTPSPSPSTWVYLGWSITGSAFPLFLKILGGVGKNQYFNRFRSIREIHCQ